MVERESVTEDVIHGEIIITFLIFIDIVFKRKVALKKRILGNPLDAKPKRVYSEFISEYTSGMTESDRTEFISLFPAYNSLRPTMFEERASSQAPLRHKTGYNEFSRKKFDFRSL